MEPGRSNRRQQVFAFNDLAQHSGVVRILRCHLRRPTECQRYKKGRLCMSSYYRSIVRTALMTFVLAACASGAFAQITLPPCSGTLLRFSVCEIVLSSNTP